MSDASDVKAVERSIKVLVVDDLPENLFAMEKILKALSAEVVTAGSGNDALRETLHHDFAVVLLDVQMPTMDGFETAALIRENEKTKHLPIIFVTAISMEERYVFKGYESGAVDYLFKPIDSNILLAKTRVFMELAQSKQALESAHEQLRAEVQERQRMEEELRLAQKLEAIGQLAAGIAHEINTPIQYIGDNTHFLRTVFDRYTALLKTFNELLVAAKQAEVCPQEVAAVQEAFENVDLEYFSVHVPKAVESTLDGVQRVSQIVLAMKDFSHLGSEEKCPVDINRALESTLTVAKNEWKYVADLETEFDASLPSVSGIGGELNQVFLNIIVNAAHAIKDVVGDGGNGKGTIRITTSCNGAWVETRISDTGTGIPDEVRDKIFDPFFTTKEVGKGTGQGLAIAHSVIVDKHGGQLDVETKCGTGTTFIIRLPIEEQKAVA